MPLQSQWLMAAYPEIVDLSKTNLLPEVVHKTADCLSSGHLVALPTETVYGIAGFALNESSAHRISQLKQRDDDKPLSVAVKSIQEALAFVPDVSSVGRRLMRRCWPGPLTLVLPASAQGTLIEQLPEAVKERVIQNGNIGLRVCDHPFVHELLGLLSGPLLLTSANISGQPDATAADQVAGSFSESLRLIVDDGPTKHQQPSTVVEVSEGDWRILRTGVIVEKSLRSMVSCNILFVCTGNTCRSPIAEGLCAKLLASKIGCAQKELASHGWQIASAGIAASTGRKASPEAVEEVQRRGGNIADHISKPLDFQLAQHADFIFTMTRQHRDAILLEWPELADRIHLLAPLNADVVDPIGGTYADYQHCADVIEDYLNTRLPALFQ